MRTQFRRDLAGLILLTDLLGQLGLHPSQARPGEGLLLGSPTGMVESLLAQCLLKKGLKEHTGRESQSCPNPVSVETSDHSATLDSSKGLMELDQAEEARTIVRPCLAASFTSSESTTVWTENI